MKKKKKKRKEENAGISVSDGAATNTVFGLCAGAVFILAIPPKQRHWNVGAQLHVLVGVVLFLSFLYMDIVILFFTGENPAALLDLSGQPDYIVRPYVSHPVLGPFVNKGRGTNYFLMKDIDHDSGVAQNTVTTFHNLSHIVLYFLMGSAFPQLHPLLYQVGIMWEIMEWKAECQDATDLVYNAIGLGMSKLIPSLG